MGVCKIAYALSKSMGLDNYTCNSVKFVSLIHDIGKIGIPNSIIFKNGKLTKKEWEIMKLHPITGADLILNGKRKLADYEISNDIIDGIRYHHERWDGSGYPIGLKGLEINIISRIVFVADTYDAMTTNRPYRKATSSVKAIQEILNNAGTQFDPAVVEVLVHGEWKKWTFQDNDISSLQGEIGFPL